MLVLSRKCETEIHIGPDIIIKVLKIRKGQVKLGIDAPSGFSVWRGELLPIPDRDARSVEQDSCRSRLACLAKPHRRHL
jgi:carbon storage regulator CsrA